MASPLAAQPSPIPPILDDDLHLFLAALPPFIRGALVEHPLDSLIEIIMDFGRPPEARFPGKGVQLSDSPIRYEDIEHVTRQIRDFGPDNRSGIERTLHRISAIRNRREQIIGLTLRVGRAVYGTIDAFRDLVESGKNILLLGPPGVGKTTKLREVARVLADDLHRRVVVVDTSNEIGGDGDIPHPAIGTARRMQVPRPDFQHAVMIEAVENHMPEAIVIDEIGTGSESAAARTIAERGVQLIGTAHGTTLENLILNPTLSDLVGGIHTVTLGDEEARFRNTSKTINERRAPPTFDIIVELIGRDEMIIHRDTASSVDAILAGEAPKTERRGLESQRATTEGQTPEVLTPFAPVLKDHPMRIYPYALDRGLLDRVIRNLDLAVETVSHPSKADLILGLKSSSEDLRLRKILMSHPIPAHFIRKESANQMRKVLRDLFYSVEDFQSEQVREAVQEAEHAIQRVLIEKVEVALAPRIPALRRIQHQIISRYHLVGESVGDEPMRHLVIHA